MKAYKIFFLLFVFSVNTLFSQIDSLNKPKWFIKPVINTGFVLVHHSSISHLVKGYPTIYEINIVKPTYGNKIWQLENNKPDIGISFQCLDFKNPSQLGYALIIAPFVEIPLNKTQKKSRVIMRICQLPSTAQKKPAPPPPGRISCAPLDTTASQVHQRTKGLPQYIKLYRQL